MCDSTISSSQFFLATHLAQQPSSQSRHASISQSHLLYYFVHVTMSRSHSHPWPRCRQKPPPKEQPMKAFATKFPCQIKTFKIVKAWCGFRTQQQLQSWSKQHSWSTLFHEYALVALLFSYASVSSQCRLASNCLDQFSPWKLNICDQDLSAACFRYHWTTDPRKKKTCQAQIKIRYLPQRRMGRKQRNCWRRTACSTSSDRTCQDITCQTALWRNSDVKKQKSDKNICFWEISLHVQGA